MKLTIDGRAVSARQGESVLDCALRHGIAVPHLCTHPALSAFGACRMCVVEIEGMKGFPTSCTTPAAEGMVVRTDTPELADLRRSVLELIMLEHPSACLVCDKRELCEKYRPAADKAGCTTGCHTCNNKAVCEVRTLSGELGLSELPVAPFYRALPVERSDPFIDRDMNLCILCGRCVRVCKELHGTATIDFIHRGQETRIGPAFGRSLVEAGCRFCGACVEVCPTGALAERYRKWRGAPEGETDTTCVLCEEGCALTVLRTGGSASGVRSGSPAVPVCVLGRFATAAFLNGPDRLKLPQVRSGSVLREAEWPAALAAAGERLSRLRGEGFALVCDTTSTLEDRHVFRRFTQEVMTSPHFVELRPDAVGDARTPLPPGTRAALLTGEFVAESELGDVELLIVQDCYGGPAAERADFVFPAAVLAEIDGTVADAEGVLRPLRRACDPAGQARPEWRIVAALASAMGAEGFAYESAEQIAREMGLAPGEWAADRAEAPPAGRDPRARRIFFRGHRIDEKVPALRALPTEGQAPVGGQETERVRDP